MFVLKLSYTKIILPSITRAGIIIHFVCPLATPGGTWKYLGQGSNLYHSSDLNHCSDNARSLTYCTTRKHFVFNVSVFLIN